MPSVTVLTGKNTTSYGDKPPGKKKKKKKKGGK